MLKSLRPLTVRYIDRRLVLSQPAPPTPRKAPTLVELITERDKLFATLNDKRTDSAMHPPGAKERIAALDQKIAILAGSK